jgi:plastocyanin
MWILALGLAALALVAAGCGDDDEGGGGGGAASESTPESTPESSGGETLTVTADPGGGLSWEPTTLTAKAGSVTLKLVTESDTPHAIEVEGNGVEEKTETITGGEGEVTADLEPGEYEFYCPVGNHKATMKGTLTVE